MCSERVTGSCMGRRRPLPLLLAGRLVRTLHAHTGNPLFFLTPAAPQAPAIIGKMLGATTQAAVEPTLLTPGRAVVPAAFFVCGLCGTVAEVGNDAAGRATGAASQAAKYV